MPTHLLTMLPAFLAYFAVAIALLALFLLVYLNVTPYHEVALIRDRQHRGSGQPVGRAARFRHAGGQRHRAQRYAARPGVLGGDRRRRPDPGLPGRQTGAAAAHQDIPAGKTAPAIFLATLSLTVGLINAACMTY
jgi:putative membrane protein